MMCPRCGRPVPSSSDDCPHCGTVVSRGLPLASAVRDVTTAATGTFAPTELPITMMDGTFTTSERAVTAVSPAAASSDDAQTVAGHQLFTPIEGAITVFGD